VQRSASELAVLSGTNREETRALAELQVESEPTGKVDVRHLDEILQRLWEKARVVSESLTRFREENQSLKKRVTDLEHVERKLISEIQKSDGDLQKVRSELLKLQSNGSDLLTKEEKEALKARIKELISRINSRL
jgi:predicted  nucleic acid-binding Zn-ribbon protein